MAATTPQAELLRADLGTLTDKAFDDLGIVWSGLSTADQAKEALKDVLPALVEVYGMAAGSLAADWYDDLRETASVRGRFRAIVADLPQSLGTDELAGFAVQSLYQAAPDWGASLELAQGGLQRRILNQSRGTLTGSTVADPSAKGWQRVGNGECGFCRMLLGRGAVYTEASADFASHDHCKCSAVPAFGGAPIPVKPFAPSLRDIPKADQARARKWMKANL